MSTDSSRIEASSMVMFQEIRDLEQVITQRSLEQNHQRLQLEKWEQQLHEREMHIVECELKLLMASNNQERLQHQTPKIQKRSGRFMRSFLNGHTNLSPSATHMISSPTSQRTSFLCPLKPAYQHSRFPTSHLRLPQSFSCHRT